MKKYRNEHKYFMNAHTAAILRGRISAVMRPDKNSGGVYEVHNVYLDDQYDSFLNGKLLGGLTRDKYRVRFYNGDLSFIRLERKHKDGALSYKESAQLTREQYQRIVAGDIGFDHDESEPLLQTLGILHRLRRLRPAAFFTYRREAYVYGPGNVRVTFDSGIGEKNLGYAAFQGAPPGKGGMLEVKFDSFLPPIIADLLSGLPLSRTEMSKYCYVREMEKCRYANQTSGAAFESIAGRES